MIRFKRVGWILGFLGGIVLIALFVRNIDFQMMPQFGARFWLRNVGYLMLFQSCIILLHSFQWGLLLREAGLTVPPFRILGARLGGYAISILSPSLSVGGEVVRAALTRDRDTGAGRLGATIIVDKYVELSTRIPLVVTGLILILARLHTVSGIFIAAGAAFSGLIVVATILLLRASRGISASERFAAGFARLFDRCRPAFVSRIRHSVSSMSENLAMTRTARLLPVFAFGFAASAMELLQIHFLLAALGYPSIDAAAVMLSLSVLGGIVAVLPGNVGGLEALSVLALTSVGGVAASGLAYAFLVRGGQLFVVALGLTYMVVRRIRRREASTGQRQSCMSR